MLTIFTRLPILAVLTGAFIISFSGIWVKLADVAPSASAFYRVFFGFIFLLLASLKSRDFPQLTIRRFVLLMICALFFALDLIFWHASIGYIGPGLATIIGNFQVFMLAAIGILFYKDPIRLRFLLSIPLAITGLFLVVGVNWQQLGDQYKLGLGLGLLTALCYTGFLLTLRKIQAESDLSFYNSLMLLSGLCAAMLAIFMINTGISFSFPHYQSFFSLLALGLFSQTIGWLLITNAMPKIRASLTGLILLLQPTLAFIWDVLFFKRPTDLLNWTGVVITIIAIYLGVSKKENR